MRLHSCLGRRRTAGLGVTATTLYQEIWVWFSLRADAGWTSSAWPWGLRPLRRPADGVDVVRILDRAHVLVRWVDPSFEMAEITRRPGCALDRSC